MLTMSYLSIPDAYFSCIDNKGIRVDFSFLPYLRSVSNIFSRDIISMLTHYCHLQFKTALICKKGFQTSHTFPFLS